jgi:hypothetical protein
VKPDKAAEIVLLGLGTAAALSRMSQTEAGVSCVQCVADEEFV